MKALPMAAAGCDECTPVPVVNTWTDIASPRQAFNLAADATLARCQVIHAQRGSEYSDTWALDNIHAPVLRLALRETFGFTATAEELRLITAAALADVKDSRLIGEWKPDNMDDGINYRAAFTQWMTEYKAKQPQ